MVLRVTCFSGVFCVSLTMECFGVFIFFLLCTFCMSSIIRLMLTSCSFLQLYSLEALFSLNSFLLASRNQLRACFVSLLVIKKTDLSCNFGEVLYGSSCLLQGIFWKQRCKFLYNLKTFKVRLRLLCKVGCKTSNKFAICWNSMIRWKTH